MVDDIRGSGSSVAAVRERVFGDGRCTCGGGRATRERGDDVGAAEEATEHGVVLGFAGTNGKVKKKRGWFGKGQHKVFDK